MNSEPLPPPRVSEDGNFYWDSARWVPMPRLEARSVKSTVELAGALVGVMAVLLPLEGVLTRWASFGLAANEGAFQPPSLTIAVDASVPELIATGLAGIVFPIGLFIAGAVFVRADWEGFDREMSKLKGLQLRWPNFLPRPKGVSWPYPRPRPRTWFFIAVAIAAPIVISFYTPSWLGLSIGAESGFALGLLTTRPTTTLFALEAAAVLAMYFALVSGLSGNPSNVEPMLYRFQTQASAAHLPDGRYVTLGRADGITYLQSCKDLTFHSVPDFQLVDARYAKHSEKIDSPSVWVMITHLRGPVPGYQPDC